MNKDKIDQKDIYKIIGLFIAILAFQFIRENIIIYEIIFIIFFIVYMSFFYKQYLNLVTFFLFFEFLMSPTPNDITIAPVLFIVTALLLLAIAILEKKDVVIYKTSTLLFSVILLFYILFIVYHSIILKQNGIGTVLTSVIPLVICIYILFIANNIFKKNLYSYKEVIGSLIIWSTLYVLNNFALFFYNLMIGNPINYRITLYDPNTLSPVPLFILGLLVFMVLRKQVHKSLYLLIAIMYVSTLLPFTRSYIIASSLIILISIVYIIKGLKIRQLMAIVLITMIITPLLFTSNILEPLIDRFEFTFSGDGNVAQRFDEYSIAIEEFKNAPFFGQGIGVEFSERFGSMVNYIHNFFFYILANLGLSGVIIFTLFMIVVTLMIAKGKNMLIKGLNFGFLAIIIYCLFFAVFKWFSFGIILGIMIWMMLNFNKLESYQLD